MATLVLYGDESATGVVFGMGAFIADRAEWDAFQDIWRDALKRAGLVDRSGDLLAFHMTDFESRQPPFDKWDNTKRVAVISELIEIINRTFRLGVVVSCSLELYKRFPVNTHLPLDHKLHKIMQYMISLYELHMFLLRFHSRIGRVEINLDRNQVVAPMVHAVHDAVAKKIKMYDDTISAPRFEDKQRVVQLQAADILAYEGIKHRDNLLTNSGRPRRKSYAALERRRIFAKECNGADLAFVLDNFYEVASEVSESGLLDG
jgi:hypothetical protein